MHKNLSQENKMDLSPGTVLPGPDQEEYLLVKKLGEGAFGQVWKASASDGYAVALKVILSTTTSPDQFWDEVALLRGVKPRSTGCPSHVVCLQNAWVGPQAYYLVTDFLPGMDLDQFLGDVMDRRMVVSTEEMLNLMNDLVDGVEWIHSRGLAHRDLKPANVQVDPNTLNATILDLGLSCFMPDKAEMPVCGRRSGGTTEFMAPEVFKENIRYPQKVDIFSLGVIFYLMVTGQNLFPGDDERTIEANILSGRHVPIDTGNPTLDGLLLTMVSPNPRNRPATEQIRHGLASIPRRFVFPILE